MCRPVACRSCKKTTWSGCGDHAEQVMSQVPEADRCTCAGDTAPQRSGGWFSNLFGR